MWVVCLLHDCNLCIGTSDSGSRSSWAALPSCASNSWLMNKFSDSRDFGERVWKKISESGVEDAGSFPACAQFIALIDCTCLHGIDHVDREFCSGEGERRAGEREKRVLTVRVNYEPFLTQLWWIFHSPGFSAARDGSSTFIPCSSPRPSMKWNMWCKKQNRNR